MENGDYLKSGCLNHFRTIGHKARGISLHVDNEPVYRKYHHITFVFSHDDEN